MLLLTFGAALISLQLKGQIMPYLKYALSFAGAYLLGMTIFHLTPEVFADEKFSKSAISFSVGFGFVLQLLLDMLSRGVEHGHFHKIKETFPISILLGLSIHAFIEGIPLSENFLGNKFITNAMFYGVIMHKIPAVIVLTFVLLSGGMKNKSVIFFLFIFSVMTPLGTVLGYFVFDDMNSFIHSIIIGVLLGSFLHISTTILSESARDHHYSWQKIVMILCGFVVAFFFT